MKTRVSGREKVRGGSYKSHRNLEEKIESPASARKEESSKEG